MTRRTIAFIAMALALAPLSAFAADKTHSHVDHPQNCSCNHVASSTATSPTTANTSQGASQTELERIWAASP